MSNYPSPNGNLTIYNNTNYTWGSQNITYLKGDKRYLKLYGNSTITGNLTITGEITNNTYVSALANIYSLQNSTASNISLTNLQAGNLTNSNNITALQNANTASNISITNLQNATTFITASQATGNTTISGNVILSGNIVASNSYFNVANGSVMIGTVNPTSTGTSCPLLVQSNPTSNNPWLNGIVCYGNLTANAVIATSVQNSGLHCWFALANRFGNSWVIANDNGTNSGNPLRWQSSPDFSNVNANMMSLSRTGNLWVKTAIGIGNASPVAPLYVTAGGFGTDPATNGIMVCNTANSAGNAAIITARTGGSFSSSPLISLDVYNVAGWSMVNDNSDSNKFKLFSSWNGTGTAPITVNRSTGFCGILNTTPVYALDVVGNVNATVGLRVNNKGPFRIDYGSYTTASIAAGGYGTTSGGGAISFSFTFNAAPIVIFSGQSAYSQFTSTDAESVTTTTFQPYTSVMSTTTGGTRSYTIGWFAVGF